MAYPFWIRLLPCQGPPSVQAVQDMLGLADRARILDLFEALMGGQIPATLALFDDLQRGR